MREDNVGTFFMWAWNRIYGIIPSVSFFSEIRDEKPWYLENSRDGRAYFRVNASVILSFAMFVSLGGA